MKRKVVKTKKTTNGEMTSINIDAELQEKIRELAIESVEKSVTSKMITTQFAEERRKYLESLIIIPEENDEEKAFRKKAASFFKEGSVAYLYLEKRIGGRYAKENKYIISTNATELACAGYKLYLANKNINQKDIYTNAKDRMKQVNRSGDKWSQVRDHTSEYFLEITKLLLEDNELNEKCIDFLMQFEYRKGVEESMLKLIFLIENCNS